MCESTDASIEISKQCVTEIKKVRKETKALGKVTKNFKEDIASGKINLDRLTEALKKI